MKLSHIIYRGKSLKAAVDKFTALDLSNNVGDTVLNSGIYKGLFENHLALNQWDQYKKYYDLYLKTQLDIKTSERNSICDSIDEHSNKQSEKLDGIKEGFKRNFKWAILVGCICFLIVVFSEMKNRKNIKMLYKSIEKIQNIQVQTKTV